MKKGILEVVSLLIIIGILFINLGSSAPMVNLGNQTFVSGDLLDIEGGYQLFIRSIDVGADRADIALGRGSSNLYEKWFGVGDQIYYPNVIKATVYSINGGQTTNIGSVTLTDVYVAGQNDTQGQQPSSYLPICTENWTCGAWSACAGTGSHATRTCTDVNSCNTTTNKPVTSRTCITLPRGGNCVENWTCGAWSDCINNLFIRTCVDQNNCGTTVDRPYNQLACDPTAPPQGNSNPGNGNSGSPSTGTSGGNTYNYYNYNYPTGGYSNYTVNFTDEMEGFGPFVMPPFLPYIIGALILLLLLLLLYIYISSVFSSIANKTDNYPRGIAWIPILGPLLISSKAAKMHWWPVLLLIFVPIPIISLFSIIFLPISFMILYAIQSISEIACFVLLIFSIIWMWKTFRAVNRPGWWVLFNIVPLLGNFIFLILLGVAAWGNKEPIRSRAKSKK